MLKKLQAEGYDTITYTFPPGTTFGDHSHSADKKDSILSGRCCNGCTHSGASPSVHGD